MSLFVVRPRCVKMDTGEHFVYGVCIREKDHSGIHICVLANGTVMGEHVEQRHKRGLAYGSGHPPYLDTVEKFQVYTSRLLRLVECGALHGVMLVRCGLPLDHEGPHVTKYTHNQVVVWEQFVGNAEEAQTLVARMDLMGLAL